jgi:hypothetical protein
MPMRHSIFNDAATEWDKTVQPLEKQKQDHLQAVETIEAEIKSRRDARAGHNPARWLKNAFRRAAIAGLEKEKLSFSGKIEILALEIAAKSDDLASKICSALLQDSPGQARCHEGLVSALQETEKNLAGLEAMGSLTADILDDIDDCYAECDSAESMEYMDAFSSNKGLALLSYMETSDAAKSLGDLKENLKAYTGALKNFGADGKTGSDVRKIADELIEDNNFDLLIDMISDFAGALTSLSNATKLKNAQNSLKSIRLKIEPVKARLDAESARARTALRQDHAALGHFRKDVLSLYAGQDAIIGRVAIRMTEPGKPRLSL